MDNCYMAEPKSVSIDINALGTQPITIGRAGENLYRSISVDCSSWLQEYPDGQIIFVLQRPDGQTYPVVVSGDNGVYTWTPSEIDTAVSGQGLLQIYLQSDEILGKSKIANIIITKGLSSGETPPDTPDWIVQVLEAAKAVEEAVEHYPYIDEITGNWFVWNVAEGQWEDTGVHAQGPDGVVTPESIEEALGFYPVSPTDLQDAVDAFTDTPVVSDLSVSVDEDSVAFTEQKVNIKTRETSSNIFNLPLANTEDAGAMSPSDVLAIQQHTSQIAALEGRTVRLLYTASDSPTAAQIEQFVEDQGYTDPTTWAGIAVVVSGTYHIWHCYSSGEDPVTYTWQDDGVDTVSQFTNSVPGIIQGAASDGKVYAENDGTGSVFGWTAFKTDFQNHVNNTSNPHQVTASQVGAYTKDETDSLLREKQDALTFDSYPVEDSVNPVKSGGLWALILDIIKRIPLVFKKAFSAGNPVQINDGVASAMDELIVSVTPKQSTTPWIGSTQDTEPYTFRSLPSLASGANREYDKLVGGSVVWNQYINSNGSGTRLDVTATITGHTFTLNGTANANGNSTALFSFETINGHRYFILTSGLTTTRYRIYLSGTSQFMEMIGTDSEIVGDGGTFSFYVYLDNARTYSASDVYKVNVIDITALLSDSTKASNWTFALQHKYFPNFHAYSLPTIQSVSVSEKVTTWKNLFDEDTAYSAYRTGTNAFTGRAGTINADLNYIPSGLVGKEITVSVKFTAIGSTNAYVRVVNGGTAITGTVRTSSSLGVSSVTFTPVSTSDYWHISFASGADGNNSFCDIQVEIGSTATTYEAYTANTYALSHTELRGIPSIVNNKLSYDGDEYSSSGTVTRKYGIVDFGSLTWTSYQSWWQTTIPDIKYVSVNTEVGNGIAENFVVRQASGFTNAVAGELAIDTTNVKAKTGTGNPPTGYLVYELATPTTESTTPFTNPQVIDEHGTESYTDYPVSQGTRDVAIPVGHKSNYALSVPVHGMDEVSVNVSGKNFFDGSLVHTSYPGNWGITWDSSVGTLTIEHKNTYTSGTPFVDITLPVGTYVYSYANGSSADLYINGSFSKTLSNGSTFTVNSGNIISLAFPNPSATTRVYEKVQLELGSTATDYEPFTGSTTYTHEITKETLFKQTSTSITVNGVTYAWDSSGHLTANGTSSSETGANNSAWKGNGYVTLGIGTYMVSRNNPTADAGKSQNGWYLYNYDTGERITALTTTPTELVLTQETKAYLACYQYNAGYTNASVEINLFLKDSAMYGGTVEMVSGVETSTMAEVDLGDFGGWSTPSASGWTYVGRVIDSVGSGDNNVLLDNFRCTSFTRTAWNNISNGQCAIDATGTWFAVKADIFIGMTPTDVQAYLSGTKLIYTLATPTTAQGSVSSVSTLDGINIFSTDGDSVSGIYTQSAEGYLNDFGLN